MTDLKVAPGSGDVPAASAEELLAAQPAGDPGASLEAGAPLEAEASLAAVPSGAGSVTYPEAADPSGAIGSPDVSSTPLPVEAGPPIEEGGAVASTVPRRRRRARLALLALLASAAGVLLLFAGWYLITRKPVSELPLPGLAVEPVPHYSFSVYGVVAPTGVAVSPDGSRIYATQTEGDPVVLIFDGKGAKIGEARPPDSTGRSHVPVYLALQPSTGDLYVSDRPTGAIYVYSSEGVYRRTFEPPAGLRGWQPLGLAFDSQGGLVVTDVSGPFNTVHQFDANGQLVRTIGKEGQFNFPNGAAVDAAGNLYVTDSNNGRLVVFDPAGQQEGVIKRGPGAGDLGLPRGTAIDDAGRVYVVDTSGQGVQLYHVVDDEGGSPAYIGRFGRGGTADGAFQFPNGVAVDGRGRAYVTDWRNNRVQVWTY
ncbi:MAG TPA: hypothetical protein VIV06_01900 [Candidatus Limnocylindrales bacterium]